MKAHRQPSGGRAVRPSAFTLVELLVSTAVLSVLLLVTMTALETMQRSWRETKSKVNQFRGARIAFEAITRNLSQATLNPYWDYYYATTGSNIPPPGGAAAPEGYVRQSELDFRIVYGTDLGTSGAAAEFPGHGLFFQAPLGLSQSYRGMGNLLNARGYFVRFHSDKDNRPPFLDGQPVPVKYRYQLMEYRPPAESVSNGIQGNTVYTKPQWYKQDIGAVSRPLADNILLFLVSPQVSPETAEQSKEKPTYIAPRYRYSSRYVKNGATPQEKPSVKSDGTLSQGTQHLLPPLVKVTMVAGEEGSVGRWLAAHDNNPVDICDAAGAPFELADKYATDLEALKEYLAGERVNFRIFTATVAIRNAVWDSSTY
ncbi:MAG TPA: Verru_Chthon cassette protein C [Prosthecobacter sp.]